MELNKIKMVAVTAVATGALALVGCGGEGGSVDAQAEETLSAEEEAALVEDYEIEAIENINETNAEAEAEKLAQEIDADQ